MTILNGTETTSDSLAATSVLGPTYNYLVCK